MQQKATGDKLVSAPRNPQWVDFRVSRAAIRGAKTKKPNSSSPLIRLPQEVMNLITEELANPQDGGSLIRLSLTYGYLYRLLARDIQILMQADVGSWQNDRIVFASGMALGIPNNVGTSEEQLEWFEANYNTLSDLDTRFAADWLVGGRLQSDQILNQYGKLFHFTRLSMYTNESEGSMLLLDRLLLLLMQRPRRVTSDQDLPVLRNLTTNEFVRNTRGVLRNMDLGEALMTFIAFIRHDREHPYCQILGWPSL